MTEIPYTPSLSDLVAQGADPLDECGGWERFCEIVAHACRIPVDRRPARAAQVLGQIPRSLEYHLEFYGPEDAYLSVVSHRWQAELLTSQALLDRVIDECADPMSLLEFVAECLDCLTPECPPDCETCAEVADEDGRQ